MNENTAICKVHNRSSVTISEWDLEHRVFSIWWSRWVYQKDQLEVCNMSLNAFNDSNSFWHKITFWEINNSLYRSSKFFFVIAKRIYKNVVVFLVFVSNIVSHLCHKCWQWAFGNACYPVKPLRDSYQWRNTKDKWPGPFDWKKITGSTSCFG